MPVHAVKGGYRWGKTGKVYPTKAAAERQARAIYASGYRDDAYGRVLQRKAARLLRASRNAEARYVREVVRVMRAVHTGFLASVELPAQEARAAGHEDARPRPRPFPAQMKARLFVYIRAHIQPAFEGMAREVDRDNREGLALLGIQPAYVPGLAGTIAHSQEENVKLVQHAAGEYADQVQEVLRDPANVGLRHEELRKLLVERGNVSVSRATFIAKDQTLKLNAAITSSRQKAAGVSQYRWSTSQDERVRPMHAALEGTKQSYDDPPVTNDAGDTNNPGEDYQCRCVAIPVIPELEPEEPEEEETPAEEREPEPEAAESEEIPGYPANPEDIPGYRVPDVEEVPEAAPGPPELAEAPEPDLEALQAIEEHARAILAREGEIDPHVFRALWAEAEKASAGREELLEELAAMAP